MLKNLLKLHIDIDRVIEDFVHNFLYTDSNIEEAHFEVIKDIFIDIIKDILANNDSLESDCIKLAKLNLLNGVPFVVLMSELNYLKKIFLQIFIDNSAVYEMLLLYNIYINIEKYVAKEYLDAYIKKLSASNALRLSSLNGMIGIDLIAYYKQHIVWLDSLISSVKDLDTGKMPELDSTLCAFGYWLIHNAKKMITDKTEYNNLLKEHDKLHSIALLITKQFKKDQIDYHVLMTYIESCEYISLSIGTELALLDNSTMIKKIEKDILTGTLCKNALKMLFKNQYEISLATDSSFVLALCELDDFSSTADGSDKVLVGFTSILKATLRNSDIIIRYNEKKFIVILLNTISSVAVERLNEIRINFENFKCRHKSNVCQFTTSIGHLEIKPQNDIAHNNISIMHYMNLVQRKLLSAQNEGKNRVI